MALPFSPNTTCDIYRSGHAPPAPPAVAGVPCVLRPSFDVGREAGESEASILRFTDIMKVDLAVDVRDDLDELTGNANRDTVYIPDSTGIAYLVTFVERVGRGLATDHKQVYLNRELPSTPITVGCCPGNLPATLHATLSGFNGTCAGVNGTTIALAWNASTSRWEGTGTTGSYGFSVTYYFYCSSGGASASDFRLDSHGCSTQVGKTPQTSPAPTCSPLSIQFLMEGDGCCTTPGNPLEEILVTVTL